MRALLNPPERFVRSALLERDFGDSTALADYIVTPALRPAFARVISGLRAGSERRAWRITGDYGCGKSSFALVLAHMLRGGSEPLVQSVRELVEMENGAKLPEAGLLPVLVTGDREGTVACVARGILRAIDSLATELGKGVRKHAALKDVVRLLDSASRTNSGAVLTEAIETFSAFAAGIGRGGILLVIDELGKLLEHAALHPDLEDVYTLQQLGQAAARSGSTPLIVIGILHQGLHAYSERLTESARKEWEKIGGRYEEIVFDQPLAHTTALIRGALRVREELIPSAVRAEALRLQSEATAVGWNIGADEGAANGTFPLHPMAVPVLVRFFSNFGQHERSLFSYLLSSEPFALQAFAERPLRPSTWYSLPELYDYVRSNYGFRLAGASYRTHWSRLVELMDAVGDVPPIQRDVLKTVALLNLIDADDLLPTVEAIQVALRAGGPEAPKLAEVDEAVQALRTRGVLFRRTASGDFRLWPNTSVNLEGACAEAQRQLGPVDRVSAYLAPYLDATPLVARRHYIETGTLRHFEVRYVSVDRLRDEISRDTNADGVVVVALADTVADRGLASGLATSQSARTREDLLVAIPQPLAALAADVQDARRWEWVQKNTPDLAHDPFASVEVARQVARARRTLGDRIAAKLGLRSDVAAPVDWFHQGAPVEVASRGDLLRVLSDICGHRFPEAPVIRNELVNRRAPSSAGVSARTRLIERMFAEADQPELGFDSTKAPPERALYLSILKAGRVHREIDRCLRIAIPLQEDDPLRLRPALNTCLRALESAGDHRVPVLTLLGLLEKPPFGVRAGLAPLLIAILAVAHGGEIAVYENGDFVREFGPPEFLRLTKVPTAFEFQLSRVAGVRGEAFEQLAAVFAHPEVVERGAAVLDVVTPLCVFAAQLPESTRSARHLDATAAQVRDVLLSAREPVTLLFRDLPLACGEDPFGPTDPADPERVARFIHTLQRALDTLRETYPALLKTIREQTATALGVNDSGGAVNRQELSMRARRVAAAARDPRLRAFALRLGDVVLPENAWAEAIGSLVCSRPPNRWGADDSRRFADEIEILAAVFARLDAVTFVGTLEGEESQALRIALTRGDGSEAERVVRPAPGDGVRIEELAGDVAALLPDSAELRVAVLARALWNEMEHARAAIENHDVGVRSAQ